MKDTTAIVRPDRLDATRDALHCEAGDFSADRAEMVRSRVGMLIESMRRSKEGRT